MARMPEDYQKYVVDYLKNNGPGKLVKAGFMERMMVTKAAPAKLHPNPDDEFSCENIGPNFEIVSKYTEEIREIQHTGGAIFENAVIVEKLEDDGYMLVNGHHRWLAAHRMFVHKMHIKIVNLVHEHDVHEMLQKSTCNRRVSFDLDEVLFASDAAAETVSAPEYPYNEIFPMRLKKSVPELLRRLQEKGLDVWVYTGQHYSVDDIYGLFKCYGVELDGILNGIDLIKKEAKKNIKSHISKKYEISFHVTSRHVLFVDREKDNYEYVTLKCDDTTWGEHVLECIGKLI